MTELYEELKALVGKKVAPITGVDDVCEQMIRHWCEAMEDPNPVYTNKEYAKKSKFGGIIAPPTMVQAWSFGPLWPEGQEDFYRHPELIKKEKIPPEIAMEKLDKAGFTGALATNTTMDFFKNLVPGDKVIQKATLSDITPEKKTGTGTGHFITLTNTYTNQTGELICRQSFTFFKFKPPKAASQPKPQGGAQKIEITKMLPEPTPFSDEFYNGLQRHELLIQKCKKCNKFRYWPMEMCPHCNSLDYDWHRASGKGTVHSYTVIPQQAHPAYASPWVALLVELEEGPRLITHGLMAPEEIHIGMPVVIDFEKVNDDFTYHAFKKA